MLKTLSALVLVGGLASVMHAQTPPGSPLSVPVTASQANTKFTGNFQITGFHSDSGAVYADGIVTGAVTQGSNVTSVLQTASAPLVVPNASSTNTPAAAATSCTILHLVLGPINLNLLGLQVTTNQIVLDISAIPGANQLLGNLLCGVAGLLNGTPLDLSTITTDLNQILGILRGL